MKALKKGLKVLLITVLAYLIQVCVMEHLAIAGVMGSVIFAALAILTVSYGKKYTFCASCIIGLMMESMLSNVPALYVIAYPLISMLSAQAFADLNERQRERRTMHSSEREYKRQGKKYASSKLGKTLLKVKDFFTKEELPAHLRIPLCAALMDLLFNLVLCVYMYLIGVEMGFYHVWKVFVSVIYTVIISLMLMVPVRYFLGMYRRRSKQRKGGGLL